MVRVTKMLLHMSYFLRRTVMSIAADVSKVRPTCSLCLNSHVAGMRIKNVKRSIATSNVLDKRRKDATDTTRLEKEDPKRKNKPPCVPIWKNMTVEELSKSLDKPLDTVFEAMIYVKNTDAYDSPWSVIDDLTIIREIVKKCGLRSIVSAPPMSNEERDAEEEAARTKEVNFTLQPRPINKADLGPREPVVTIMGHVDHGKTTLLDALRNSNIAAGEAGGITQHIGAFRVPIRNRYITFLDTPGHAAFSALRNRGAQATDIVILVVAADDGVMEQTRESIRMAKEANVPIIVAINKIDKGNADVERTKSMLLQEGIQLEDIGGDTQSVSISALKRTNIPLLLDTTLLQAELLNLQSEVRGRVEGVVLESSVDHGRGKLSTGLIQRGVLRKSAILVAGTAWAKVRGIFNEHGDTIQEAGPSVPVEIIGWREIPSAGDKIFEVDSESRAKQIVEYRRSVKMEEKQVEDSVVISAKVEAHEKDYKVLLEEKRKAHRYRMRRKGPRPKEIFEDPDPTPKIYLIVKGDVDGSVESFLNVLDSYDCQNQCRLDVVHYGIGDITDNDVKLAETFNFNKNFIYAFNVAIPEKFQSECSRLGIKCRDSKIIYRLVDELRKDIETVLLPKDVEEEVGLANVIQTFEVTDGKKKIPVAGSRCTKGTLRKDSLFKLLRGPENEIIFSGKVSSIRHLKNEVDSIKNGVECGIALSDLSIEPQPGDTLLCYRMIQVAQKSEWDPGF